MNGRAVSKKKYERLGTASTRLEALFLTSVAISINARRFESAKDDQS